jgi:hypothetical protein
MRSGCRRHRSRIGASSPRHYRGVISKACAGAGASCGACAGAGAGADVRRPVQVDVSAAVAASAGSVGSAPVHVAAAAVNMSVW